MNEDTAKHNILDQLVKHGIAISRGEARRTIAQGGVRIETADGLIPIKSHEVVVDAGDTIRVGVRKSFVVG